MVVLAGGIGSRLRPWTNDVPKPLLPMLDATLLERVVEGVPSDLVDEVIVAGGYKVELIREYFAKADVDFDVRIVPEDQPLGTGGALGNCRDIVSGRFACFNGDIVSSLDVVSIPFCSATSCTYDPTIPCPSWCILVVMFCACSGVLLYICFKTLITNSIVVMLSLRNITSYIPGSSNLIFSLVSVCTVSYTHLTLPTKRIV